MSSKTRTKCFLFSICGACGEKDWQNTHDQMSVAVNNRHNVQYRLQYQVAVSQLNYALSNLNLIKQKLHLRISLCLPKGSKTAFNVKMSIDCLSFDDG
jgi:hypothetical protein